MFAKVCFAKLAKNLRYCTFAGGFDDIVQVNESPTHVPGQNRSDGGLAGAHKTSQDQPGKPPLYPGWRNIHQRIIERGRKSGFPFHGARAPGSSADLDIQSRRDDLKVAQDVSPGLELEEKTSPVGTVESIPLQPSLRDWSNCWKCSQD